MSLKKLKVVFMGTPAFAVPTLKALIESGCEIKAVVTQPDRPAGRGRKITVSPVKALALSEGLALFQPERVKAKAFISELEMLSPDVIVVVAFGRILPKVILDIPPLGCINVHASLLPAYRGAAPVNWAVIQGESVTGVTTMVMDEGLDTGDILLKEEVEIGPFDDAATLYERLSVIGAKLLVRTLEGLMENILIPQKQDDASVSYAPMLKKEDGLIDWSESANNIVNRIRGLLPWPVAQTTLRGRKLKIFAAKRSMGSGTPGTVLNANEDGVDIAAGEGSLSLVELQIEGKKRMKAGEFLRGFRVEVGERFG